MTLSSIESTGPAERPGSGSDGFDVREFARTARGSLRAELDLAAISAAGLGTEALRLARTLRDLERSTLGRLRNLLVTATHKDARVTAFLTTWAYEKFWLADALDAIIEAAGGEAAGPELPPRRRHRLRERSERRGPVLRAILANVQGVQIVAAHVTTGLVDEWIAQAAYRRLADLGGVLSSFVETVAAVKDRHIRFFAEEAERRLGVSERARSLTRTAIRRAAWPIGSVDRPAAERDFFEQTVFGTPTGRVEAERIGELLAALPGLSAVARTVPARLVP